jgi:MFS superfamily sulfate permease-like transporter
MLETVRRMPAGIRIFLVYAFAILGGIGISLRYVVDQAIGAPISGTGVVVMVLLAYTIFTTTLVLQRKEASRSLAMGLASLTVPVIPFLLVNGLLPQALVMTLLAAALLYGLTKPSVRAWLSEP